MMKVKRLFAQCGNIKQWLMQLLMEIQKSSYPAFCTWTYGAQKTASETCRIYVIVQTFIVSMINISYDHVILHDIVSQWKKSDKVYSHDHRHKSGYLICGLEIVQNRKNVQVILHHNQ